MDAAQRLKAAAKLRQYVKDWDGTQPADEASGILQDLSQKAFAELKAHVPDDEAARKKAAPELRKFITAWEGTSGGQDAKTLLNEIAEQVLAKLKPESVDKLAAPERDAAAGKIMHFQSEWKDTQAARDATSVLDDLAHAEFDEFKKSWPDSPTKQQAQAIIGQLKKFQTKWKNTATADKCDEDIAKLGQIK